MYQAQCPIVDISQKYECKNSNVASRYRDFPVTNGRCRFANVQVVQGASRKQNMNLR